MQDSISTPQTAPDCAYASAAVVCRVLDIDLTEGDFANLRVGPGPVSFQSLKEWFEAKSCHVEARVLDARSLAEYRGVCIVHTVLGTAQNPARSTQHFLVALPQGPNEPPIFVDATLSLDEQRLLAPETVLQQWTGKTLIVTPNSSLSSGIRSTGWILGIALVSTLLGMGVKRVVSRRSVSA